MNSLRLDQFESVDEFIEAVKSETRGYSLKSAWSAALLAACIAAAVLLVTCCVAFAEPWTATAYCGCVKCCGKSDCITASNVRAKEGITVAVNWLPFGTPILINGKRYVVQDRGAKSIFGTKKNHIKAVDIYFNSHKDALRFGRRKVEVEI